MENKETSSNKYHENIINIQEPQNEDRNLIDQDQHQDHYHDHSDEESLSLSELPLHCDHRISSSPPSEISPINLRSSEPLQEFFEFSNGSDHHIMSSAEEIIVCGRLLPFREPPQSTPATISATAPTNFRRRSESLSELKSASKASVMVMRTSRSLDYQRLRRTAELTPAASPVRRRWSALPMFGTVKFPPEMELGDIKSRQARRNGVSAAATGGGGGGASWRLLKALSCKDHTSVAVTASFCVPHV